MRYLVLACDYDDTFAEAGRPADEAREALAVLRQSGRRAVLVTGRTLPELLEGFSDVQLFDAIVLENGAVLHWPSTRETMALSQRVPPELEHELSRRGVRPLIAGDVILSTRSPHEGAVLEAIRALGLELHIVFNGDSVLVVPPGIDKGSGLGAALRRMGLSPHEVVGIGSGENDHSLLHVCECSAAVANAVSSLKRRADFVTDAPGSSGLVELIDELVTTDLEARTTGGRGDVVVLAETEDGVPLTFRPYGQNILVSGPSGAGKSTFASGLIERLVDRGYQLCIIDPEGDYGTLEDIVTLGTRLRAPQVEEVLEVLLDPAVNVVVNLLGIPLMDRPDFFAQLLPRLQAMRARTGRPHWLLIDEVHHLMPKPWGLVASTLPRRLSEVVLITYRPREVAAGVLELVDTVVVVGPTPQATIEEFSTVLGIEPPPVPTVSVPRDEVVVWERSRSNPPVRAKLLRARAARLRHLRKYAEGDLGPKSFVFRGRHGRLRLRARNLASFCELASGVDEDTWLYHLGAGDYSRWVREVIKDDDLARELSSIERSSRSAAESARLVRDAIDRRYVLSG